MRALEGRSLRHPWPLHALGSGARRGKAALPVQGVPVAAEGEAGVSSAEQQVFWAISRRGNGWTDAHLSEWLHRAGHDPLWYTAWSGRMEFASRASAEQQRWHLIGSWGSSWRVYVHKVTRKRKQ